MNVAPQHRSIKHHTGLRLFVLFEVIIFLPIIIASFWGCARTVETEVLHDTDTIVQHDTDSVNRDGPAWVRFINFLTKGGVIQLKTDPTLPITPFGDALQVMGKEYIPIRSDTSLVLYTEYRIDAETRIDSIAISADSLKPSSLTTIVLFQVEQDGGVTRISPYFANDSLRVDPPPPGMAYFRFINGVADHPQPSPTVNLYMDDPNGPALFLDAGGNSRPISFFELRNYIVIPTGQHTFYVRKDGDPAVLYSAQKNIRSGGYYTARLNGSKTLSLDRFTIDEE